MASGDLPDPRVEPLDLGELLRVEPTVGTPAERGTLDTAQRELGTGGALTAPTLRAVQALARRRGSPLAAHAALLWGRDRLAQHDAAGALTAVQWVAPASPLRALAMMQTAWLHHLAGRGAEALTALRAVLALPASGGPLVARVQSVARVEHPRFLLDAQAPGAPFDAAAAQTALRPTPEDEEGGRAALERLGQYALASGRRAEAFGVFRHLTQTQASGPRACWWGVQLARIAVTAGTPPEAFATVQHLAEQYGGAAESAGGAAGTMLESCRYALAGLAFTTAAAWHQESLAPSSTANQPPDPARVWKAEHAGRLYGVLLQSFPQLDRWSWPMVRREDWFSRATLAYYYGDLLLTQRRFCDAGPMLEYAAEAAPGAPHAREAALSAAYAYTHCASASGEPQASAQPRELSAAEGAALRALRRVRCMPLGNSDELRREEATAALREAIQWQLAGWQTAALSLLEQLALGPERAGAQAEQREAARRYVALLRGLRDAPGPWRDACGRSATQAVPLLQQRYCAQSEGRDEGLCSSLTELQRGATAGGAR